MAATVVRWIETGGDATQGTEFWASKSGAITRDTTQFVDGASSIKLSTSSPAATASMTSGGATLADAGSRISFWFRISGNPTNTNTIFAANTAGATNVGALQLTTAGKINNTPPGAVAVLGSKVLSANTWYHMTYAYHVTDSTHFTFKVWINGILDSTVNSGTLANTVSDRFLVSNISTNGTNYNIWIDSVVIDNGSDTDGFPGALHVTFKRPNANGGTNSFDTTVSTTNSGYGTGNSIYINEIPVSTGGERKIVNNSATGDENFAIEGRSVGEHDLTSDILFGFVSWMDAAGVSTDKIWCNGSSFATNFTLNSTPGFAFPVNGGSVTSTYPSSTSCVGMSRPTGNATDAVLVECGMLIAYISVSPAVGSSTGTGTASGVGAKTAASIGAASGTGVASGTPLKLDSTVGSSSGSGDASGISAKVTSVIASAAGSSTAAAISAVIRAAVAVSAGVGSALGIGRATKAAVGNASGSGTGQAVGRALVGGHAQVTQIPIETAANYPSPLAQVTQISVETTANYPSPSARVYQIAVEVIRVGGCVAPPPPPPPCVLPPGCVINIPEGVGGGAICAAEVPEGTGGGSACKVGMTEICPET